MNTVRPGASTRARVREITDGEERIHRDNLATEEPLEIRLVAGGVKRTLAITMRTPGADFELAAGFLYAEGVISGHESITSIAYCTDRDVDEEQRYNIVTVMLAADELPELRGLDRHFTTTSACGVCGKESLEALKIRGCPVLPPGPSLSPETVYGLPGTLRAAQGLFESTGGLHAAALFDTSGELVRVREDVGRHNAVDKLVGWALLADRLPLSSHVLMVSGRSSYEIMQKAVVARIPIVCAVSAPSSLAVALADEFGMTLVGFLRDRRFNVYAGAERINLPVPAFDRPGQ
jgi:FdhD protein